MKATDLIELDRLTDGLCDALSNMKADSKIGRFALFWTALCSTAVEQDTRTENLPSAARVMVEELLITLDTMLQPSKSEGQS